MEDRTLLASNVGTLVSTTGRIVPVDPVVFNTLGQDLSFLASDYNAYAQLSPASRASSNFQVPADEPNGKGLSIQNNRVTIDAVAKGGNTAALQTELTALGAQVTGAYGTLVSAMVPLGNINALVGLSDLSSARPFYKPVTNAGLVDSQATAALKSDVASAQFATTGAGVTVGVISDSFNARGGESTDISTGDLPSSVNVLQDYGGGEDEGRAMAQLIHDIAPGAGIAFSTGDVGEAAFAQTIINLAKPVSAGGAGASVIVDDIGLFEDPMFQDGVIAQAINYAVSTYGISYFSSAGNQENEAYQSAYNPTTVSPAPSWAAGQSKAVTTNFHNFNPGGTPDIYQPITVEAYNTVYMTFQWDQSYQSAGGAGSTNDVDVYMLNYNKTSIVGKGVDSNTGSDPIEFMQFSNNTGSPETFYLAVNLYSGSAPGMMKYVMFDGNSDDSTQIANYGTNTGASYGHDQAVGAAGVGASFYYQTPAYNANPALKEDFSSGGGSPILFAADGTRLATPEYRPQPRFVSVDGIDTTFFGGDAEGNGLPNFFGTSAAAPDAAAVAALMKSAVPSLTAQQIYTAMQNTALDMGAPGFDYETGYGLIQADKALAAVLGSSISGTVFNDPNKNGIQDSGEAGIAGATVFLDANGNNSVDSGTSSVSSTNVPVAIPDGSSLHPSRVTSSLSVSGLTGRLTKVVVHLNVTHPKDGDLGLTLISPSGMRVTLIPALSENGANFTNTVFDDASSTYILYGAIPFTGTYRPFSALANLIGENPNGTWQLEARDYQSGNTGTITAWSLDLSYADPSTTTDANGHYSFNGLPLSSYYGTYNVNEILPGGMVQTTPASPYQYNFTTATTVTNANFGQAAPNNTAPTAASSSLTLADDGRAAVTLTGNDAETPASSLVFTVTSLPLKGSLFKPDGTTVHVGDTFTGSPQSLTYVLNTATLGAISDSFNYTVTDTGINSDSSTALTSAPATVTLQTPSNSSGVLRIIGTPGNDTITIAPETTGGGLKITLNGTTVYDNAAAPAVTQIRVFGGDGDDTLTTTAANVYFDGEAGSNKASLQGTTGADTFTITTSGVTLAGSTVATANAPLSLLGLDGNDIFKFNNGATLSGSINGGTGTNTIDQSSLTAVITANLANTTITGVGGTFASIQSLLGGTGANTLMSSSGSTTFAITSANSGTVGTIAFSKFGTLIGGAGNDTFKFSAGATLSGTIDGGTGTNTVDESAYTTNLNANLTTHAISAVTGGFANMVILIGGTGSNALTGPATGSTFTINAANGGNVGGVTFTNFGSLLGGAGNDIFKFTSSGSLTGSIFGGDGTNTIDESAVTANVNANLITSTINGVGTTFGKVQSLIAGSGTNTLNGPGAGLTYAITAANSGTVGAFTFGKFGNIVAGGSNDVFAFSAGGSLSGNLDGGGGSNTIDESAITTNINANFIASTISKIAGTFVNIKTLIGGTGANALTGPSTDSTYTINAADGGTVGGFNFSHFGSLVAGAGNDTFKYTASGSLSGSIYGGTGTNTIDESAVTTPIVANLTTSTINGVGTTFSKIQTILGGTGANSLIGPGAGSTFNITAANAGNAGGYTFTKFGSLTGGSSNDVFKFSAGASLSGTLDGGGGTNTIDETAFTTNVNFNLTTSVVSGVTGGFVNIKVINAGTGANALTGPATDSTFNITGANAGNAAGVTFTNFGALIGGAGNDTFKFAVGGSVSASIYGGLGANVLDESAFTTNVAANLATSTINGVGTTFSKIASIIGGTGTNTLTGPAAGSTYNINGGNAGNVGGVAFSKFANVTGGSNNDTFKITGGGSLSGTLDGGGGSDTIDESAITSNINANLTTNTITRVPTFANIKSLIGGAGANALTGPAAGSTINISGANAGGVGGVTFSGFGSLIGGPGNDVFAFTNGGSLSGSIYGGSGANTIDESAVTTNVTANLATSTITGVGTTFSKIQTLIGSSTSSTLVGPAAASTFTINAPNAGNVGGFLFSNFGSLTGGAGNDVFQFSGPGGQVTGSIDGGAGSNTITVGTGNTANLATLTITTNTGAGTPFSNVQSLVSVGGYLIGPTAGSTFNFISSQAVSVAGITCFNFGALTGGAGDDVFKFSDGATFHGSIVGGGGVDTLDYSAYTTAVNVDLTAGTATGVSNGIGNIENVYGGSGNDTITGGSAGGILIGGPGNDTLNGGSGRSILIGGTGTDTLNGGSNDDILIGGTTTLDGNFTALDTILAEWQSADSYATRVNLIKNGGGLNGANTLVWTSTVLDDNAVDNLLGNAGTDWFFIGTGDTADNQPGEQVN